MSAESHTFRTRPLLIVFVFMFSMMTSLAQQLPMDAESRYAYIASSDNAPFALHLVDPNHLNNAEDIITFDTEGYFDEFIISPNKVYAVIITSNYDTTYLYLLHLPTLEITQFEQLPPYQYSDVITRNAYMPQWSPDSSNILYMGDLDDFINGGIMLYDLSTGQKKLVGGQATGVTPVGYSWHPNSQYIIQITEACLRQEPCYQVMILYDTVEESNLGAVEFPYLLEMCDWSWSPDNSYYIFLSYCYGASYSQEVFMWQFESGTLDKITNHTISNETLNLGLVSQVHYAVEHNTLWQDNTHLLISYFSSNILEDPVTYIAGLSQYDVVTQITQQLDEHYYFDWQSHPTDNNIFVYRMADVMQDEDGYLTFPNRSIYIGQLSESSIPTAKTILDDGCYPSWSPDGQYLSYLNFKEPQLYDYNKCDDTSMTFVSYETGQREIYTITGKVIRHVGWVSIADTGI